MKDTAGSAEKTIDDTIDDKRRWLEVTITKLIFGSYRFKISVETSAQIRKSQIQL